MSSPTYKNWIDRSVSAVRALDGSFPGSRRTFQAGNLAIVVKWRDKDDRLVGRLDLPVPFGSVEQAEDDLVTALYWPAERPSLPVEDPA